MAEDKKSFILYCDLISVVEKLIVKDRENKTNYAGELFLHILQYVNDQNPIPIDFIIEMAFEPIKLQLKRDLKKFIEAKEEKSLAGRIGNLKRWNPDLYKEVIEKKMTIEEAEKIAKNRKTSHTDNVRSHHIANIAVNDNVNVNDTVNVNVINNDIINEDKIKISSKTKRFIKPTLEEVKEYCFERQNNVDASKFINFYEANGWKVGRNSMKDWKAAIRTWENNNFNLNTNEKSNRTLSAQEQLDKRKAEITQRNKERFGDFDELEAVL